MTGLVAALTPSDWLRLLIAVTALAALARMAYRARRWFAAPVDERFLWLAVAFLATSTGYSALDLIGDGVPGSERLALTLIALAYLHLALHLADRRHAALADRRRRARPIDFPDRRRPLEGPHD